MLVYRLHRDAVAARGIRTLLSRTFRCKRAAAAPLPKLILRRCFASGLSRSLTNLGRTYCTWLLLLDPDHLQTLRIPLIDDVCSFFLANGDHSLCPFPSLRSFDLEVDHETFRVLPRLLSKSPALRSLRLLRLYPYHPQYPRILEALVPLTVSPVPYLEEYRGHTDYPQVPCVATRPF